MCEMHDECISYLIKRHRATVHCADSFRCVDHTFSSLVVLNCEYEGCREVFVVEERTLLSAIMFSGSYKIVIDCSS